MKASSGGPQWMDFVLIVLFLLAGVVVGGGFGAGVLGVAIGAGAAAILIGFIRKQQVIFIVLGVLLVIAALAYKTGSMAGERDRFLNSTHADAVSDS